MVVRDVAALLRRGSAIATHEAIEEGRTRESTLQLVFLAMSECEQDDERSGELHLGAMSDC